MLVILWAAMEANYLLMSRFCWANLSDHHLAPANCKHLRFVFSDSSAGKLRQPLLSGTIFLPWSLRLLSPEASPAFNTDIIRWSFFPAPTSCPYTIHITRSQEWYRSIEAFVAIQVNSCFLETGGLFLRVAHLHMCKFLPNNSCFPLSCQLCRLFCLQDTSLEAWHTKSIALRAGN